MGKNLAQGSYVLLASQQLSGKPRARQVLVVAAEAALPAVTPAMPSLGTSPQAGEENMCDDVSNPLRGMQS